jgi:glutathione synthase/RimK-type ligase-like ATP-grasp enzyme
MKECFKNNKVNQADYVIPNNKEELINFVEKESNSNSKFIVKSPFSSKGKGLYLFNNKEELLTFFDNKENNTKKAYDYYVVEKFYNYSKEYRLHVTVDGCFYTCRKKVKKDTPEGDRWHRHNTNSVWIVEENAEFEKQEIDNLKQAYSISNQK